LNIRQKKPSVRAVPKLIKALKREEAHLVFRAVPKLIKAPKREEAGVPGERPMTPIVLCMIYKGIFINKL
jgi:hypothetical protein